MGFCGGVQGGYPWENVGNRGYLSLNGFHTFAPCTANDGLAVSAFYSRFYQSKDTLGDVMTPTEC